MLTIESLANQVAKSTAILSVRGFEQFYADPTTPIVSVIVRSYRGDDAGDCSWMLSVEIDDKNPANEYTNTETCRFSIDKTLSNAGQSKLWSQLLEWFKGTTACDANLAAEQPLESGSRKSAMPAAKVAVEVFDWFINDVGVEVGEALRDGKLMADHPFVTIDSASAYRKAIVSSVVDNNPQGALSAQETLAFLEAHTDAVIYPSRNCTGVENSVLYDGMISDKQRLSVYETNSVAANFSPIKRANWIEAIKEQLVRHDKHLWQSEGVYRYAGFETPPAGHYVARITEW